MIRTSDVRPAHRHEAWRSIVCDTLGPLDFRSDPSTPLLLDEGVDAQQQRPFPRLGGQRSGLIGMFGDGGGDQVHHLPGLLEFFTVV